MHKIIITTLICFVAFTTASDVAAAAPAGANAKPGADTATNGKAVPSTQAAADTASVTANEAGTDASANAEAKAEEKTSPAPKPIALKAAKLREPESGVYLPGAMTVAGIPFRCMATGLREVVFLDVYALTFCLDNNAVGALGAASAKPQTPQARLAQIRANPSPKLVAMHMLRDVSAKKMGGAFRDSLGKVLTKAQVEKLMGLITTDARKGESVLIYSQGDTLTIDMNGASRQVKDATIAKHLWDTWLAPGGVSTLRKGMLKALAQPIKPAEVAVKPSQG